MCACFSLANSAFLRRENIFIALALLKEPDMCSLFGVKCHTYKVNTDVISARFQQCSDNKSVVSPAGGGPQAGTAAGRASSCQERGLFTP